MLNLLKIWFSVVLTVMLTLAACSDDTSRELLPDDEEAYGGSVSLLLQLRLSDGGVPRSRAGMSTPGTSRENVVNTVCLFIYDAESRVLTDYIDLTEGQVKAIQSSLGLVVTLSARKGQKVYVYAVANPTDGMRRVFLSGGDVNDMSFASAHTDYWDVINEFVPGSDGHQTALEDGGTGSIPMTGRFKADGSDSYVITIPDDDDVWPRLKVTAEMSRIVAKVHVLAEAKTYVVNDKTEIYVNTKDKSSGGGSDDGKAEDYTNWIGWIRLSDVRYMPNGINKSTYIFPHVNEEGGLTDCNMDLDEYLGFGISGFDFRQYGRDFIYYDGLSLHEVNALKTGQFAQVEQFDQARLGMTIGTGTDPYTQGMYCPENYFDIPGDLDFYSGQGEAIPMVTHLSIASRLVPKDLLVLTDFPGKLDEFFEKAREQNFSDDFYESYGITREDIDIEADAAMWDTIKTVYFGEEYTRTDPVDNVQYGLSTVFRKDFYMFSSRNIREANSFINWSLIARGLWSGDDKEFSNGKYPKNTYYVYDTQYDGVSSVSGTDRKYVYLVAGAVALAKGDNIGIKLHSVPHVGGWGYYYTYIDNNNSTVDGVTPFTASQVTRNTYYLVTVNNFGTPGGTITDPEFIKANTESVNWDYDGRGDIDLH